MQWEDRVYGDVAIDDPDVLALIACPTFQRLKGIRQAGPSAFAYPFKTVTRFEHSLGVFLLLRRFGAPLREQIAGLLHDVSHTAFSHAVDFVFTSEEQDYHEQLKSVFLNRPDLVEALVPTGFSPDDFLDDSIYPLLERPLPWLCADRLDYFLRDGMACGVVTPPTARRLLGGLVVIDQTICFVNADVAREAVELFSVMNRDWWASPTESYIYNEFADALREAVRLGALRATDLFEDDAHVLEKLHEARSPLIEAKLKRVVEINASDLVGFVPKVVPKTRWIDPPVRVGSGYRRLSELS